MKRILTKVLLIILLSLALAPDARYASASALAQSDSVAQLLAQMTTKEKVGQLFIVGFWGRNPSPSSRAGLLIQEYKVGGVVLLTGNNNLVNNDDSPAQVAALCARLQDMALEEGVGPGIPLLIAIEHEGDGYPYTQITGGTTPLPSPMAIGATWNTRYAEQAGEIAGRELSAMGVNVVLGPAIDVLDDPRPGDRGDIGTRVFGGDPYWVSEMGRAYIRGIHAGSQGKVLAVAKHFPGHGGTDRLPGDEVATVDKSLQELRRVELVPFFAVTNPRDPDGLDRTDAIMSSHIRYRGLYGDIRQFTRPIPFDAESMQALLDLPEFREWRETGLMISDSLGMPAVRKYYDPQLRTFPHRQIAREAFLAGNDLLLLSRFALDDADWVQQFDNIAETVEYFGESYDRDPMFAARVDEAVARILRAKLALYPEPSIDHVLPSPDALQSVGQGSATVDAVARRAATILQPTVDSMPPAPRRDQDILIFAEERVIRECSDPVPECDPRPLVAPSSVQEVILRLYGPEGTGQVDPERVQTRTYAQLKSYLTRTSEDSDVGPLLEGAEWIVFLMLDPDSRYPDSDALKLFLAQNAQQIYDANTVVLAHTAPYYLDTTEISKLTAYYVFYSKTSPSIEASVRALFGELRPDGRSPVSIEGTSYDLSTQLAPDPSQQIALELIQPDAPSADVPVTVRVRTRPIRDRNGNPVPDGTQVRFVAREDPSGQMLDTAVALTASSIAEAELSIDRPGRVVLLASSGETGEGRPLPFQATQPPTPTSLPATPTRAPTLTALPAPEPTATAPPTPTATPAPPPTPTATPAPPPLASMLDRWSGRPTDLFGVLGGMLLAVGIGYAWWGHRKGTSRRARLALAAWIGGLVGYLAYGWGWIPVGLWVNWPVWLVAALLAFLGASTLVVVFGLGSGQSQEP